MTLLSVIGAVLSIIIGLWKFFSRKARQRREAIKEIQKEYENGKKEDSTAQIIGSLDKLNRL